MPDRTRNPLRQVVRCCVVLGLVGVISATVPCRAADSDVIINELMYHPPDDRDDLEYIELFNRGKTPVDLSGWSFTKGFTFAFPEKATLAPGAYLVICCNRAAFAKHYGADIPALGDFTGRLSNGGEKIEISDAGGKVIELVDYSDDDPWPTSPDGNSPSLERISPFASGKEANNWAASKMSVTKSPAGTPGRKNDSFSSKPPAVSEGAPPEQAAADGDVIVNELMYHPPEDRDDLQYIELYNRGKAPMDISRWSFTNGLTFVFPETATMAAGSYLVICRDRAAFAKHYGPAVTVVGDFSGRLSHGGEKIELSDANGNVMNAVKYSDKEPWPTGADGYSPSLERICPSVSGKQAPNWSSSNVPVMKRATGTPGRKNDSFASNLPPVVSMDEFKPPPPGRKASVTVEVTDADGVKAVTLLYRLARAGGETTETAVSMQRIAGDEKKGTYRAAIGGQPEGSLVRFRIRAVDAAGTTRTLPSPNEPRPSYSYSTFVNANKAAIAFAHIISVTPPPREVQSPRQRSFLGRMFGGPQPRQQPRPMFAPPAPSPARGNGAFIYMPPGEDKAYTFDHVYVRPRRGGYKVHFQKDRTFKGITGINVVFDGPPRWVLSEELSFVLYRMAGVTASATEHVRVWLDGRLLGYHLLIEQPNKSFLRRHAGDDSGNLYKLRWYGRGVVGLHEKKTNVLTGHDDLLQVIDGLNGTSGTEQWAFIQKNFDVEEFINYYAVNMCILNWDGFFNNHFVYHDTGGSGKWQVYPWDEDKTWGDYDGASSKYDWHTMPLTYGMRGDRSPAIDPTVRARNRRGYHGGVTWWRHGGYFAEPLLANAEFRRRFLVRLEEMCDTLFTEEKFLPIIDALEKRLEPEVGVRANATSQDAQRSLQVFRDHIQTFRSQLKNRREFLLAELKKAKETSSPE